MVGPLLRSLYSAGRSTLSAAPRPTLRRPACFPGGRGFSSHAAAASSPPSPAGGAGCLDPSRLRNVAVIAHVDHGKTTLMDELLRQCGANLPHERALDSISLERERGITIASKVTSLTWKENELNMVDTPGHADFGGEVERVIGMVEGAILVVDAVEGPLAQTKFVLDKALKSGLLPILFLNKIDRPEVSEERCNEVESKVFDLFADFGATDEQLEFPVLYGSAKYGWASSIFTKNLPDESKNMSHLLDAIVQHVPAPAASLDSPLQILVSMMERDYYLGRILTGRIALGVIRIGDKVHALRATESGVQKIEEGKVVKLMKPKGSKDRITIECAGAGDIISVAGLSSPIIGDTVANIEVMTTLPTVEVEPPTISMTFGVNDSPLAGRVGTHLTGGKIGDRLKAEAETNLAINVLPGITSDSYEVQGRGELQLAYTKYRGPLGNVRKGALVSMASGVITAHALMSLEARGILFVSPGTETYDGMIVGEHSRDTDLDVNPVRTKELTNIRAPGKEETVRLSPPREMTIEEAIGYVAADELIEITPKAVRLRKRYLDANKRKMMRNRIKD